MSCSSSWQRRVPLAADSSITCVSGHADHAGDPNSAQGQQRFDCRSVALAGSGTAHACAFPRFQG